ncbi:MAG: holo-ACP synthase [Actinobacteria bacterium]|jgi:holo-[acyl-carrier protein] synthase|nr:holo-ACP synthase [Actinomycetota bacterium]
MTPPTVDSGIHIAGAGVDAVDVKRFRAVLSRHPELSRRLFTDEELAYANRAGDPAQRLAARFAAKEAVAKAMGTGIWKLHFANVEVTCRPGHAPTVALHGNAQYIARTLGVKGWRLSITHTDLVAVAFALAVS